MQMQWVFNLNSRIQHLAFEANGQHISEVHKDLEIVFPSYVTKNVFFVVKSSVKNQCKCNKKISFCLSFFFIDILFVFFLGM